MMSCKPCSPALLSAQITFFELVNNTKDTFLSPFIEQQDIEACILSICKKRQHG